MTRFGDTGGSLDCKEPYSTISALSGALRVPSHIRKINRRVDSPYGKFPNPGRLSLFEEEFEQRPRTIIPRLDDSLNIVVTGVESAGRGVCTRPIGKAGERRGSTIGILFADGVLRARRGKHAVPKVGLILAIRRQRVIASAAQGARGDRPDRELGKELRAPPLLRDAVRYDIRSSEFGLDGSAQGERHDMVVDVVAGE